MSETEVKLDLVIEKLTAIEELLYGSGGREGIRIDVDRMKQSHATHKKVLWAFFTAMVGMAATYFSSYFK